MNATLRKYVLNLVPYVGRFAVNKNIPVIYYHDIVEDGKGESYSKTDVSVFKRHMEFLHRSGYKTYTFDELEDVSLIKTQEKKVLITFDDGYVSNYSIVFPVLKDLGLKFNIFVAAGEIENSNEKYLKPEMIYEMACSGIAGFGAHTFSHIDATQIHENNFEKEVIYTNRYLRDITGADVKDFCFPFGHYNWKTLSYLSRKNIYKRLYTSDHMPVRSISETTVIGRIGIENNDNMDVFIKKLKGWYDILYYLHSGRV
ncbi:MAG: polysaccharide deacetylase family protein [Clostridia bacterium]|nr:polysaccharide deacetylase family protein [Clostridia bacterium]